MRHEFKEYFDPERRWGVVVSFASPASDQKFQTPMVDIVPMEQYQTILDQRMPNVIIARGNVSPDVAQNIRTDTTWERCNQSRAEMSVRVRDDVLTILNGEHTEGQW